MEIERLLVALNLTVEYGLYHTQIVLACSSVALLCFA